ncbi:MAG: ABC transporter substrate-binding protein [Pseudomonadota bacterium]
MSANLKHDRLRRPRAARPGLMAMLLAALAAGALAPQLVAAAEQAAEQVTQTAPADVTPHDVVRQSSADMTALLASARAYASEDPERYYAELQALLEPVVDFRSFARLVMAVHFKRATTEQRERFASSFKSSLVRTYANALLEFSDQEIRVLDATGPLNARRPIVNMEIETAGGTVYPLSYTMGRSKAGQWQMKNIIINGINMGLTFRNQFASAVRDKQYGGDLDRVIDAWGGLVAEVDVAGE